MASSQPDREIWYVSSIQGVRQYVRPLACVAYVYTFLRAGEFSRGALAFIHPRYSAFARLNGLQPDKCCHSRTSLQCNSLASQSSKVFTPSSFTFRISFSPVPVRDETAFRKFTFGAHRRARRVSPCKEIIVTPRFAEVYTIWYAI